MTDTKTFDLGHGWYFNQHTDGSATVRNPDKGQRMDLPKASVETLKSLCRLNHVQVETVPNKGAV